MSLSIAIERNLILSSGTQKEMAGIIDSSEVSGICCSGRPVQAGRERAAGQQLTKSQS